MAIDWDHLVLAPLHAAFGEAIRYQPATNAAFTLEDAVVDRAYVQVGFDGDGAPVTAWRTIVGIRIASCPAGFVAAAGDRISARGYSWQVSDAQADGKGNVVLVLAVVK
ncbi:MAG TPA: hypothetical protein VGC09_12020 [Rhodopila sp.]